MLLWLAAGEPDDRILAIPRHGVWRYRHGAGGPPLFKELASGTAASETVLEVVGGDVLYRSIAATDVISLNRNRVPVLWKSARFVIRRLEDLASGAWQPNGLHPQPTAPAPATPSGTETLLHVGKIAARATRRKLRSAAFQHQWFLGVRPRMADRMPYEDPGPWREVLPPPDRSYADPFVVAHDGETFLFLELLEHATDRGRLAVGRIEADGRLTDVEPILPMAHHTSYPYVFRDGGRMFMIPETGDAGRVELFAATDFPTGWERVATLLEGANAVDATVIAHDGRYWMWVTIAVPGGRLQDETFLYIERPARRRLDAAPAQPGGVRRAARPPGGPPVRVPRQPDPALAELHRPLRRAGDVQRGRGPHAGRLPRAAVRLARPRLDVTPQPGRAHLHVRRPVGGDRRAAHVPAADAATPPAVSRSPCPSAPRGRGSRRRTRSGRRSAGAAARRTAPLRAAGGPRR